MLSKQSSKTDSNLLQPRESAEVTHPEGCSEP